jgi:hypothetical protein
VATGNETTYFALKAVPGLNLLPVTDKGETLLHTAVKAGNVAILEDLFGAGLDPTMVDSEGNSPLHTAVQGGAPDDVIEILLREGCDPNLVNKRERNCFSYASQSQAQFICEIVENNAEVIQRIEERKLAAIQAENDRALDRRNRRNDRIGQRSAKEPIRDAGKSRVVLASETNASILATMTKQQGRLRAKPGTSEVRTEQVRPWGGSTETELFQRDVRKKVRALRQEIHEQLGELERAVKDLRDEVVQRYGGQPEDSVDNSPQPSPNTTEIVEDARE